MWVVVVFSHRSSLTYHTVLFLGSRRILGDRWRERILRNLKEVREYHLSLLSRKHRALQDCRQASQSARTKAFGGAIRQSQCWKVSVPHSAIAYQSHSQHCTDQGQQDEGFHRWLHRCRQLWWLLDRNDGVENSSIGGDRVQRWFADAAWQPKAKDIREQEQDDQVVESLWQWFERWSWRWLDSLCWRTMNSPHTTRTREREFLEIFLLSFWKYFCYFFRDNAWSRC